MGSLNDRKIDRVATGHCVASQGPGAGKGLQQKAIGSRLNVASERQVAANRRNARKSTGPRSSAGKRNPMR